MLLRILLGGLGVSAAVVAVAEPLMYFESQVCNPENYCELSGAFVGGLSVSVMLFAIAALVAAWRLHREDLHGPVELAVALGAIAGATLTLFDMRPSPDMQISPHSAAAFQLWEARPLVGWLGVAVVLTVLLRLMSGGALRAMVVIWPIACSILSLFALTYLLPADNSQVAGLHGLGVVRLPQSAGWIYDSSGRTVITRDDDPLIYMSQGREGYVATVFAGDYSVTELCTGPGGSTPLEKVGVHVVLGGVTNVPDRCPPS